MLGSPLLLRAFGHTILKPVSQQGKDLLSRGQQAESPKAAEAEVISQAIAGLHQYIDRENQELISADAALKSGAGLNYRQEALIAHALRNPGVRYSIEAHRKGHSIAYETRVGS
jgi:hypothetical protein